MKKSLTLFLTTLTIFSAGTAALNSQSAAASAVVGGIEYWSASEIMEFNTLALAEQTEKCDASDLACLSEVFTDQKSRGGIYGAWHIFKLSRFLVTSINPEAENMRVLYQDDDITLRLMGIFDWPQTLNQIYMALLDEGLPDPREVSWVYDENNLAYHWYALDLKNGIENPGVHVIIAENEETNSPGFFPANQEVEISLAGTNFKDNPYSIIYQTVISDPNYHLAAHDFSECLNSPFYEKGMECRVLFGEDTSMRYEPYWPGEMTATRELPVFSGPSTTNPNNPAELPVETPSNSSPELPTNNSPEDFNATNPSITNPASINPQLPLVPNTGINTARQKTVNFPWWLATLIVSITLLIAWWFLPTARQKAAKNYENRKNSKKSPKSLKKSEKTLDI